MELNRFNGGIKLLSIFLPFFLFISLEAAPLKLKVVIDNASVMEKPEIGGKILARFPLNTVLNAESKQGEWYKVYLEKGGIQIPGYIHEMLVEEMKEEELTGQEMESQIKTQGAQAKLISEINLKIEESRTLVIQGNDLEKAIRFLRPLVVKVFEVADTKKRKEFAAEIFLWIGLAYTGQGDENSALNEFKNMFEIDNVYAKEITRNIINSEIVALIQQAEKEFLGIVTEYTLAISTEPKEAKIIINGKEIGLSPEICSTTSPKVVIEIEKEGFKPVREELFLTRSSTKKEFTLERIGRNVEVKSVPMRARVFLDEKDTEKVTNCLLQSVRLGLHKIGVIKENYAVWEGEIEIDEGTEPFVIEVVLTPNKYDYIAKWGAPDKKVFQKPTGIAVDSENYIYIVHSGKSKIKRISPGRGALKTDDFRRIKNPAGIAVDNQGYIYVADAKGHCVIKFDEEGKFIQKWGKRGKERQHFMNPSGIAIDSNNDIYVVDSGNNRIKRYSHTGILKKVWGRKGTSDGGFVLPTAVALSQKNEIFVLDRTRVQKFSSEGEFIASWGKAGSGDGAFNNPMGMCIDKSNFVFVADSGNNRIQKFDENGKFITKWGNTGTGNGQMIFPIGVAVDKNGYISVVERDNNRVQIFGVIPKSDS
ncbi:MAG: 6-bladed beta-propeller [Candidatus Aminicenantes bacterium]|nr:6-bladed beta-propeller [Candidatus Aminicenantes bacterium]